MTDPDDPLTRLPGAQTSTGPDELAGRLTTLAEANRKAIGGSDSTLSARSAPDAEDWPPAVVVIRQPQACAEQLLSNLEQAARSCGSGVVLVVAGPRDSATWRLQLADDGSATLEPLGLRITAVAGLDEAAAAAAAGLLDLATVEDIVRPTPLVQPDRADHDPDVATDQPLPNLDPLPVEVTVLAP